MNSSLVALVDERTDQHGTMHPEDELAFVGQVTHVVVSLDSLNPPQLVADRHQLLMADFLEEHQVAHIEHLGEFDLHENHISNIHSEDFGHLGVFESSLVFFFVHLEAVALRGSSCSTLSLHSRGFGYLGLLDGVHLGDLVEVVFSLETRVEHIGNTLDGDGCFCDLGCQDDTNILT